MITDLFLLFIGIALDIIAHILSAVSWSLPTEFYDSVSYFISYLHYLDFLLPIDTFMTAVGVYLTFISFWFMIRIGMWLYHIIRHGGDVDFPGLGAKSRNAIETQLDRAELLAESRRKGFNKGNRR